MFAVTASVLRRGALRYRDCQCTMTTIVSGNKTSQQVKERLKKEVAEMKNQFPGFRPGLVVLQVGDRDDSNLYISMKLKAAAEIGINANHIRLPETATEDEVLRSIVAVNENPAVHGLIVQLSLDSINTINAEKVTNAVAPEKDVDGITSTPLGEGKRTTALGLAQALGAHLNINAFACVQEPTPGSCFGARGIAVGGGYSQIVPLEEVSLQSSGQNELISAASKVVMDTIKAHAHYETKLSEKVLFDLLVPLRRGQRSFSPAQLNRMKKLGIEKSDPLTFTGTEIRRFVRLDIDPDTATDPGSLENEIMAILSLSSSVEEMQQRLAKIVVATSKSGDPVTTEDLDVSGPLAMLLKGTLKPVLMQTVEGTPVFLHTSPLADIAQGSPSILADKLALKMVGSEGFVVTESGHGADIGLEKFFNIKCRCSDLRPDVVVMVATVRTLKMHGGAPPVQAVLPLPKEYSQENLKQLERGCCHLKRQVENAQAFGLPVIVGVNKFSSDTRAELELVCGQARQAGAFEAVQCTNWSDGGAGALALAEAVQRAAKLPGQFRFLYDPQIPAADKLRTVAQKMYGAKDIELSPKAKEKLALYTKQDFGNLPVCIAKTRLSLSNDPMSNFMLPITDIKANAGAGFLCCLTESTNTEMDDPIWPCFHGNNLYSSSK
ncbi:C-1-tetrahydrofolate synthase, cytoplasmic-like [Sinocyclocheilus grahami]|uniref:C-1-tetrahydrofolate synthase, cytoplasmic-like n=1 Tax=Sinocyclocheilus grahami TaxID=75366 RepID=UPI0007ACF25D|nr:PREDICTED: C-1-tetrahydrofolate synthase, cytoplasmic-like [Sinocyclocheilus grahami]